jgi:hypothetical protein
LCIGSVTGSSPITSYTWNFGDGTQPDHADPTAVTVQRCGYLRATVVVTDENGLSSSAVTSGHFRAPQVPIEWTLAQCGEWQCCLEPNNLQVYGPVRLRLCRVQHTTATITATPNLDGTTITSLFTARPASEIMLRAVLPGH